MMHKATPEHASGIDVVFRCAPCHVGERNFVKLETKPLDVKSRPIHSIALVVEDRSQRRRAFSKLVEQPTHFMSPAFVPRTLARIAHQNHHAEWAGPVLRPDPKWLSHVDERCSDLSEVEALPAIGDRPDKVLTRSIHSAVCLCLANYFWSRRLQIACSQPRRLAEPHAGKPPKRRELSTRSAGERAAIDCDTTVDCGAPAVNPPPTAVLPRHLAGPPQLESIQAPPPCRLTAERPQPPDYSLSSGLFTPRPPRLRTCV